jgi:hypothetical protein
MKRSTRLGSCLLFIAAVFWSQFGYAINIHLQVLTIMEKEWNAICFSSMRKAGSGDWKIR